MGAPDRRGVSRERQLAFGLASVVVLAALVVFAIANLDLTSPRESLCGQAEALQRARLLETAQETLIEAEADGETCAPDELEAIHRRLTKAQKSFGAAAVFAAIPARAPHKRTGKRGLGGAKAVKTRIAKRTNTRRAVDRYLSGLDLFPFDAAALKGLEEQLGALPKPNSTKTGTGRCRLGRRLTAIGLLDLAAQTVPEGLPYDHEKCAKAFKKLSRQRARAASLTLKAEQLVARDGDGEAVRRSYASALLANAQLTAARTGLEGAIDDSTAVDETTDWLSGIPTTLKAALPWIAVVVITLLLLALGLWIAVRQLAAHSVHLRGAFRHLGAQPGLSFLARAATPEVRVKSFEGDDSDVKGADFSALLEAGLVNQAGREQFAFDWLSKGRDPDGSEPGIADLLTEVPETKLLGTLIKTFAKLFRRRAITVSGRLIPSADDGAGVLLKLEGNGRFVGESISLWERAFDPSPGGDGVARRLRLVPAATVWVRHQVAAAQARPGKPRAVDWRAEALFTSGVVWQAMEDWRRAEALYAEARERDETLLPATHNLAVIDLRNRRYRLARRRVESIQSRLGEDEQARRDWPTLATAARYTRVLALAYSAAGAEESRGGGAERVEERERELTTAVELARGLVRELAAERPGGTEPGSAAARELAETLSPTIAVLASLAVRRDEHTRQPALQAALNWGEGIETIERSAVAAVAEASEPWRLVHGYLLRQPVVSRRSFYNVACYLTTLAQFGDRDQKRKCLDYALQALDEGLVGGYLQKWVLDDPSLQPLRESETHGERFKSVVEAHAVAPHPAAAGGGG